jgi:hypothetical protein
VKITPENSLWMAGYASRVKPSQGRFQDLYAKALALEDENDNQAVIVTMDLLGFSASFVESIAGEIHRRTNISRRALLFNASHTHAGPATDGVLEIAYDMSKDQRSDVHQYTERLKKKIVETVLRAMQSMEPVTLSFGKTTARFAVNRRVATESGFVIGANRQGPVDHSVPFLVVDDTRGHIRAIIFGYACHCTTLRGDNYLFHGDYAGVAQEWLEARYPEAFALFLTGTAGDANPYPRGTKALAEEHGTTLAKAVDQKLMGPLTVVEGPIEMQIASVPLRFSEPLSRSKLLQQAKSENRYERKHAERFLKMLDEGRSIPKTYPYPVQVWKFGHGFLLVALAGEVVVDYSIRLKKELSSTRLWVAAYSNDVFAYIPSQRVLREGGYEAVDSMIYYGQPGPFAADVEDRIIEKVIDVIESLPD